MVIAGSREGEKQRVGVCQLLIIAVGKGSIMRRFKRSLGMTVICAVVVATIFPLTASAVTLPRPTSEIGTAIRLERVGDQICTYESGKVDGKEINSTSCRPIGQPSDTTPPTMNPPGSDDGGYPKVLPPGTLPPFGTISGPPTTGPSGPVGPVQVSPVLSCALDLLELMGAVGAGSINTTTDVAGPLAFALSRFQNDDLPGAIKALEQALEAARVAGDPIASTIQSVLGCYQAGIITAENLPRILSLTDCIRRQPQNLTLCYNEYGQRP